MICRNLRRFHSLEWAALALSCCLVGCGLIEELLPTSSTSEEGTPTEAPPNPSSAGSSPNTPTPYPAPTTGVSAPGIHSPSPGSELVGTQPTFVVVNSSTGDKFPVTYCFEVATDDTFQAMVATAQDVAQGSGGHTSWQVPDVLAPGSYFWRSRAKAGYVKSSYSAVADFALVAGTEAPTPGGGVAEVVDLLTNGTSVGEVQGGVFTPQGWKVTNRSDYIRYEIAPRDSGFVEWETTGLQRTNPSPDQFMLFGMWDPTRGDYRANPFRVHIQKLDTNHNPPYIRLRWIANGEQHDEGYNYLDWDPGQVYSWRIEWGPAGDANEARVFLNGQVVIRQTYRRSYQPDVQWVELGIAERVESIVGVTYANLRIGSR